MGKELFCLQQKKKSISQIQYLCNEGTVVGITHPSMGQRLQGKHSEARLPPVLIIVLLAAWGKALGLGRANLVADIRLPAGVAAADPIPLVRLLWNCLAHARLGDVFRMPALDTGEGVSLN